MHGCDHTQVQALQWVREAFATVLLAGAVLVPPVAAQVVPLDSARKLYNDGRFAEAIELAARLRAVPGNADGANMIIGRAQLERYRQTADRADLVAARQALRAVEPARLTRHDRVEYLVGLGQSAYLEEYYGAAAELFESALEGAQGVSAEAFDRVLDWWATALDRQAQSGLADNREALYERIRDVAQRSLLLEPGCAPAAYWLVVAHRSLAETQRAWEAAIAGWLRAPLSGERAPALRSDLDRLVLQAIIPERVRQLADSDPDRERAAAQLREVWETIKKDWSTK